MSGLWLAHELKRAGHRDSLLGLVRHVRAKVAADHAVPGGAVLFVELLLDVCRREKEKGQARRVSAVRKSQRPPTISLQAAAASEPQQRPKECSRAEAGVTKQQAQNQSRFVAAASAPSRKSIQGHACKDGAPPRRPIAASATGGAIQDPSRFIAGGPGTGRRARRKRGRHLAEAGDNRCR